MTYATVDQVGTELGRTIVEPEKAQIQQWLDKVERLIKTRLPDLDQRVTSGLLDRETVADIEVDAVTRKALNPQGLRTFSRSVDDATIQQTIDSSRSSGKLELTDEEWERLLPVPVGDGFSSPLAFTPGW